MSTDQDRLPSRPLRHLDECQVQSGSKSGQRSVGMRDAEPAVLGTYDSFGDMDEVLFRCVLQIVESEGERRCPCMRRESSRSCWRAWLAAAVLVVGGGLLVACGDDDDGDAADVFSFEADDLCEWIDADTVSAIVADSYSEHGATPIVNGFEESWSSAAYEGCIWTIEPVDPTTRTSAVRDWAYSDRADSMKPSRWVTYSLSIRR